MKTNNVLRSSSILAVLLSTLLGIHFETPVVEGQGAGCTDAALSLAEGQLTDTIAYTSTTQFPVETNPANGNKWSLSDASHWTSGFFPGWMWFMYEKGLSGAWFSRAQAQTGSMLSQDTNASDHDIGFKILGSYGNAYRITRDPADLKVIQTAAQSMTTLYRPTAGVIESWPNYDSHITVIIDNMMNLELLFFAAKNGGNSAWYDMAVSHAVKTMENHVRADGSTYHVVDYNTDGTVFSKFTVQGAGNETTWSRGQAWGLYGFTMTYRYTRDSRFLQTAQALADYFISHLPSDFVPYWDFSKSGSEPRDSSAAAIAAAGLLELSTYVAAQTDKDRYRNAALNIQTSLSSPAYLGDRIATDGILLHGSANVPGGDFDKSLSYGDYYFIQACYRAKTPPATPANLQARAVSPNEIDLTWTADTGAVRYSAKRSTISGGPYTTLAPPPVLTTNSYRNTGLSAGTTYYYVVSAIGAGGESPDSAQTFAVTPKPVGPMITSLVPSSETAGRPAFTVIVNGANFATNSVAKFNGNAEQTSFVNSNQLHALIAAADIARAGAFPVTVFNPSSGQTSNAATFTVKKAGTTTLLASSVNPAAYGRSVTLTATVRPVTSGVPTGTVTFKDGATILGSRILSGGKATFPKSNFTVGSHAITVVYGGDTTFLGSTSAVLTQTINKAATSTTVTSSLNPSRVGNAVTFTATVKSSTTGTPTGSVTFKNGTSTLGTGTLSSGKAALTTTALTAGSHSITVVYGGNANFNGSASPILTQTVNR